MATAAVGRKPKPPTLRIVAGRGEGKDGIFRDAAGRPIPRPLDIPRGVPTKPDTLSDDASRCWDWVVEARGDLLSPIHQAALEVLCETYSRWMGAKRQRQEQGGIGQNSQGEVIAPWAKLEAEAGREFQVWCAEFGLTPAAENKVGGLNGGDENNPFS